jgi:hypothetical protein
MEWVSLLLPFLIYINTYKTVLFGEIVYHHIIILLSYVITEKLRKRGKKIPSIQVQ